MALAALISAYHDAPDSPGELRATLPIAGRTLVERQARLVAAAGAAPVVILVERVPPELVAAIDRLRAEGVGARIARTVEEAAAAIAPDQHLLVVADGLLAERTHLSRLFSSEGASLLTVPDTAHDDRYERIDAHSRWAGLALVDGDMLRRTVAMLQDWDLQSTLLRRAVQAGARQVAIDGDRPPVIAERLADLAAAQARLVADAGGGGEEWVSRYLLAPLEAALTRALMPSVVTPFWTYGLALTLTGLGAVSFLQGWRGAGLALLLLATPLNGLADRLAALRMQRSGKGTWLEKALPPAAAAALAALGWDLAPTHGWGCLVVVATTILFMLALRGERVERPVAHRHWLAERKGMSWLLLPFAAAGAWTAGLAALAFYACASFFWAQRAAHGAGSKRPQSKSLDD